MTDFRRAPRQTLTPLLTHFVDGAVDHSALKAAIDRQVEAGIHGIIVGDAVGEIWSLTDTERDEILQIAVSYGGPHLSIVAGSGTNCTRTTIERSLRAQELGANALLVTIPYYSKPTLTGVVSHFRQLSDAVEIPIIIDDEPMRTAVDHGPALLERLMDVRNIVGVSHGNGRTAHFSLLRSDIQRHFVHFSRDDAAVSDFIEHGGNGMISPLANVVPALIQTLVRLGVGVTSPLGELVFRTASALGPEDVAVLKEASSFIHQTSAEVRPPLVAPPPETIVRLRRVLAPFARCEGGMGIPA